MAAGTASQQAHTVIRGGRLLDLGGAAAPFTDVLLDGDRVAALGAPGMAAPPDARLVDAAGLLLMPGLVNAHTHGHGSLAKGMGDRWSLEMLLNNAPWISGKRTLDDKQLAARLNAAELVLKGCTAAYDLYFEFPLPSAEGLSAVLAGYAELGVRAVIAPMMADRTLYEAIPGLLDSLPAGLRAQAERIRLAPYEESIRACEAALRGFRADRDQARLALAPTIPLHCSDAFMVACRRLADAFQVGIHMHLAESKGQAVSALRRYGCSLTAQLERVGLLHERFVAAHGIWLDADDMARLAEHGCSVAHNPGSNLRLGAGVAPVRDMRARGLNVGIGTDGSSSSDNQNMFEAVRLAAYVSRVAKPDPADWLAAGEALQMATEGSARALGFGDRIGSIAPGRLADIVFLDLANISFVPLNNPLRQIVNCEDSSAVRHVMIGGRLVLQDRRFTALDYARLCADAEAAAARLREATADAKRLAQSLEGHVAQYCVGLARQHHHVHRTIGPGVEA